MLGKLFVSEDFWALKYSLVRLNAGLGGPISRNKERVSSSLGLCPLCSLKSAFPLGKGEGLEGPKGGNSQVGMGWEKEILSLSHSAAGIPGRVVVCVAEKISSAKKLSAEKMCLHQTHNNFWYDTFSICLSVPKCSHCWYYCLTRPKVLNVI